MRALHSTSLLCLLASLAAGCAVEGNDTTGNTTGGPGGGKGDDPNEQGLHVTARTTTLGPQNEIRWPVVVDPASDVDDAINAALSFEAVTGEKLEEVVEAWSTGAPDDVHPGIQSVDFQVDGNVRNVLSLSIQVETLGAYVDFFSSHENFNSNTGERVQITDILDPEALPAIAEELDSRLEREIALQQNRFAAEIASGEIDATLWDGLTVTVADLEEFSTTDEGITFRWDAGFPHALTALEPAFNTSLTIDELDFAISADGLWAEEF